MNDGGRDRSLLQHLVMVLHFLIVLGVFLSPILVSWKYVMILVVAYYVQLAVLGGCILTQIQFRRDVGFYYFYLRKIGFHPNKRQLNLFVDYLLPWLVLGAAVLWQRTHAPLLL